MTKDRFGRRLDAISVATTQARYAQLLGWAQQLARLTAGGSRALVRLRLG